MKLEKEHSAAHDRISSPQFLRACQTLRQSLYPILGSACLSGLESAVEEASKPVQPRESPVSQSRREAVWSTTLCF